MSTAVSQPAVTPEDLLKMPDGDRYELVDGHLVERDMGFRSSYVGGTLFMLIRDFCERNPLGWAVPADCGYQCFPDQPNRLRRPDASFITLGRLPVEQIPEGHCRIPPDIVAEVLSPNDLDYETDQKIEEYLRVGVRLIWVINPETKTVLIYRADGSIHGLREQDELSGEDVLPGFRCRVGELFVMPGEAR
jgi:Uma2 family endonuclease